MVDRFITSAVTLSLALSASLLHSAPQRADKGMVFRELEQRLLTLPRNQPAAEFRRAAAEQELSAATWRYLPEFSAAYRYRDDVEAFTDDDLNASSQLSLRVSQDIFRLLKVRPNEIRAQQANLDALSLEHRQQEDLALFEFRQDYTDMLASRTSVLYYQKLVDIYARLMTIQKTRLDNQEALRNSYLDVEKQRLHYDMLLDYHQNRVRKLGDYFVARLQLENAEYEWQETSSVYLNLTERQWLDLAVENGYQHRVHTANAEIERSRATAARYQDLRLEPYVGLNFRTWHRAGPGNRTSPEIGVRFSMPVFWPFLSSSRKQRHLLTANAWSQEAHLDKLDLAKRVQYTFDRYKLVTDQITDLKKQLEWHEEKLRIQRSNNYTGRGETGFDEADRLFQEAEVVKSQLEFELNLYERDKMYFELLYVTGVRWPEEIPQPQTFSQVRETPAGKRASDLVSALWVWQTPELLADKKASLALVEFCAARRFNRVYLSVNREIENSPTLTLKLQSLVKALHAGGLRVSALFGDPNWVWPQSQTPLWQRVHFILAYNQSAETSARFDAVHLDIEPHALSGWDGADKTALVSQLAQTVKLVKKMVQESSPALALELDLPLFYGKISSGALQQMVQATDTITLMAYRRPSSEAVLKGISQTAKIAERAGKNFVVGLSAGDFDTAAALKARMQQVVKSAAVYKYFGGIALHDYKQLKTLLESQNNALETITQKRARLHAQ